MAPRALHRIRSLFICSCFLFFGDVGFARIPKVLLLNSYHNGYLFSDEIVRGVRDTFNAMNVKLYVDYLDSKRQFDDAYVQIMIKALHYKALKSDFDLIIGCDNNAFNLLKEHRDMIYGADVPVVFCGVNYLKTADLEGLTGFTGVNEKADILINANLMHRLYPNRSNLLIITDETLTGKRVQGEAQKLKPALLELFASVDILAHQSKEGLCERLKGLDDSWAVLYAFFFRDQNQQFFEYDVGARMVSECSPVPVHCLWNFSMNSGMVGGYLVNGYLQGVKAAEKALLILHGTKVEKVAVQYETPLSPIFDYNALKRFDVSAGELPIDSMIINRPEAFSVNEMRYFKCVVAGCIFFTSLVGGLLVGLKRSKKITKALRDSQSRLFDAKQMLQSVLDGASEISIIATNKECEIVLFNRGASRMLGYCASDIVGKYDLTLFHDERELKNRAFELEKSLKRPIDGYKALVALAEQVGFEHGEWTYITNKGERLTVSLIVTALRDDLNKVSGYLAVAQDITSRRISERRLEAAQAYISKIVDSMPSWIIGVNEDLSINQWNQTVQQQSGVRSEDALGRPVIEILPFLDAYVKPIKESLVSMQIFRDRKISIDLFGYEEYVNLTIYPLHTDVSASAVIRIDEVTEQVKLEHQMVQVRKMEAVGQLASGVAHDFNNLLGGILGLAEILKEFVHDTEGVEFLALLADTVRRGSDLTEKLLSYSRKGKKDREPVDVHQTLSNTVSLLRGSIDKRIMVQESYCARHCSVMGNESLLQSAFLNLGVNASYAMPEGGILGYSTQVLRLDEEQCKKSSFYIKPGDYLMVEVRDNGAGIAKKHLPHIFEPFYTTRGSSGKGTGLGLATVYGTMVDHKGAITVSSNIGAGTVFCLYFPLSVDAQLESITVLEEPIKGSGCILVVDDEVVIRMTIEPLLKSLNYQVVLADGGREAIKIYEAKKDKIDLIILDMVMPDMSGQDTLERIKKINPNAKVLMSSGYQSGDESHAIDPQLCNGFIQKPYTKSALSRLLIEILGK